MVVDIKSNITTLKNDIAAICRSCGRDASEIKIVAVSKTKPIAMIKDAMQSGITDFGENYIQEAEEKAEQLKGENINWHFVGSVQTNKVKYLTKFCGLLHSLDRESLAEALQKRLEFENKTMDALFQINTSGEATKSGANLHEAVKIAKQLSGYDRIKIKGMMTIAENSNEENSVRQNYKQLKGLFEEIKVLNYPNFELKELSMGMSGDYKIAIEEGTTIIRVGSNIFGARNYNKS